MAVAVTSSCHCSDLGDRGSAAANFDSDPIVGPKRKLLQESSDISGLIPDAIVLLFAFSCLPFFMLRTTTESKE